eukprot:SAG31_NODE_25963_length_451_cov_0.562500_1_plen_63_part_10
MSAMGQRRAAAPTQHVERTAAASDQPAGDHPADTKAGSTSKYLGTSRYDHQPIRSARAAAARR